MLGIVGGCGHGFHAVFMRFSSEMGEPQGRAGQGRAGEGTEGRTQFPGASLGPCGYRFDPHPERPGTMTAKKTASCVKFL